MEAELKELDRKDRTIFVVDDNPDNLGVTAGYLKSAGYTVAVASSGSSALKRAERVEPVVILLDIKMPGMDGFEVCRKLKKNAKTRDIPVIFLTALEDIKSITKGFQTGGVDYLTKPVKKDELLARVLTQVENYLYKNKLEQEVRIRTAELEESKEKLQQAHDEMEKQVQERTADLLSTNQKLQQEVSERRRMEDELKQSHKQLRRLSSHLHSSIEKERELIAREIHDDLGQTLTILKMDLSWLAKKLDKNQQLLIDKIRFMSAFTHKAVQAVKMICADLRPSILDDFGLLAAIEWQADEFKNRTGIKCTVATDSEDIILDEKRSTALFRIFQETLTNALRHANAGMIEIDLKKERNEVALTVKDNGIGITKKQISLGGSFGLLGIRERIYAFGGQTEISGLPGKGTTIRVSVPIEKS